MESSYAPGRGGGGYSLFFIRDFNGHPGSCGALKR